MQGENTQDYNATITITVSTYGLPMEYSMMDSLIITIILPIILFLGVIGNLAFLYVLFRVDWMRTSTNAYLAVIAVIDIVFLFVGIGEKILRYCISPVIGDQTILGSLSGCVVLYAVIDVAYFMSIFLVSAVSYERYLAVCHPIRYRTSLRNKCRTGRNVILSLIAGAICACATIPGRNNYVMVDLVWPEDQRYSHFPTEVGLCIADTNTAANVVNGVQAVPFFVALIANTILYIRIVRVLNPKQSPILTSSLVSRQSTRNQVAMMLVATGLVFFLCLAPFEIISFLQMLSGSVESLTFSNNRLLGFLQLSRVLMYINSAINSVIYVIASAKYRRAFGQVYTNRFVCFNTAHSLRNIARTGLPKTELDIIRTLDIQRRP